MAIRTRDTASLASLKAGALDVDEQHREGMRTIHDELGEVHFGGTGRALAEGRRQFMKKAGLTGVVLSFGSTLLPASRLMPAAWGQESEGGGLDDLTIALFAEQVELAAVAAYEAAAGTGLLDPTAVEVGTLFATHHADHAGAFASFAGDDATGVPNQAILDVFAPMITEAADQAALLQIAFDLEQGAASTYHFALGVLGPEAAAATSTILPIEAQHAVVLSLALGEGPEMWFPTEAFESAAVGDGTDPLAGFDPAVFG
jgi:hypothetical protein